MNSGYGLGLRSVLLGSAAALAISAPCLAQAQQSGATSLTTIEVDARQQRDSGTGPVNGYVAKQTTTGSKTNTAITDIPQSVSVVGREQIDDRGAQKIDEALRYTAGVFSQPFGADTDTNWFFIRGFNATQTGTYLDGLQLFSNQFGGFYIDSYGLERIEVLRGAASVLYGGANPGGIVNYVSKRPTGERLRNAEVGVYDTGKAYLGFDIGDRINPDFDYRVNGRIMGGHGYTDFEKGFRGFISPSLTWRPDNQNTLTILSNYTHIDEKHNGGGWLPYIGTVIEAPFGRFSRKSNYTEPDLDVYRREQATIGYEYKHVFDNGWSFGQNLRYGHSKLFEDGLIPFGYDVFSPTPSAGPGFPLSRIFFGNRTTVDTVNMDNQLQGKALIGGVEHSLLFGVDAKYINMDQLQVKMPFGTVTNIDAINPIYGLPQGPIIPDTDAFTNARQRQVGVYVQDQLRFGDGWLVTLNGRYDAAHTDVAGGPFPNSRNDGAASGRAGIAYKFNSGITPYASVATFFNPLIGASVATPSFAPETGEQYEIGVKYAPVGLDALFTAALFDLTKRNSVTAAPGSFQQETQLGKVRSRGFELEAQANITRDLKAVGALTVMNLKVLADDDPSLVGKRPIVAPEQQASLGLDYTFRGDVLDGLTVGGGVRYVGEIPADPQNSAFIPAATVFDAKIGYTYKNWKMRLNVTNLFDRGYVSSCQSLVWCFYGEGRRALLTTSVTW